MFGSFFSSDEFLNSLFRNSKFFERGYTCDINEDITKYPDYKKIEKKTNMGAFIKNEITETWTDSNGFENKSTTSTMEWKEDQTKKLKQEQQIKQLESKLKQAVEKEEYTKAAEIQQEIKQLKTK